MTYYGVKAVVQKGQRIDSATERQPPVYSDDVLVAIINNGLWAVAPDVTDAREYSHFYGSYAQGYWLNFDLYNLPKKEIPNCPDEGRVPLEELKKLQGRK